MILNTHQHDCGNRSRKLHRGVSLDAKASYTTHNLCLLRPKGKKGLTLAAACRHFVIQGQYYFAVDARLMTKANRGESAASFEVVEGRYVSSLYTLSTFRVP